MDYTLPLFLYGIWPHYWFSSTFLSTTAPFPIALYRTVPHKRFLSYPKHANLLAHFNQKYLSIFAVHESGCKSTGARNKSQHAMGSENHTVNIMINIILGRSFWLLHKLGWKPLAQFMLSSDITSTCKSKILDVAHLSGTRPWLRLQIQKMLLSFYSSSVAASLSVLKFLSYMA